MAILYDKNGKQALVKPAKGSRFKLREIEKLLGGEVERVPDSTRRTVFCKSEDFRSGYWVKSPMLVLDKGE